MQRRSVLSLLISGASVTALAACGGGDGTAGMEEQKAESSAQESAAQPTAEPTAAPAQPTAEPAKQAEAAPTAAPTLDLPVLGQAPEIDLAKWFNSEPITMASLEGKAAALVVFWTYT